MSQAPTRSLSAGIAVLMAVSSFAQLPAKQPRAEYLPLDATGLAGAVGVALETCSSFFAKHGVTVTFDEAGELTIANSPSGDVYRGARDAGSILTRASAYRVLTAGTAHLSQYLDLASSPDAVTRRGAVWILCRPPEPDEPVVPMVIELLERCRFDPDPLIRATMASLPHDGAVGARDPNALVRASWWKGFMAAQFDLKSRQLTPLQGTFLERALIDQHAFVRMAARLAHERLADRIPEDRAAAISELVASLATDPSPWPRPDVKSWRAEDRTIGWMNSLSQWIPLPWTSPRTAMGYRDGAVGNPDRLVQRLEFLRSARNVKDLPVEMLRAEAEAELRSTAASMRFPQTRANSATAASRLKLIEDPSPDVRLAAVITFDAGAGYPYPASLAPDVQRYILGGVASSSRWENHAAVVLARGLRATHPTVDVKAWATEHLLGAGAEAARRATVLKVLTALLVSGAVQPILARLEEAGWPVAPSLETPLPAETSARLTIARSLSSDAERAVAALIAAGPRATTELLQAMASTDPRDEGLRATATRRLAARSVAELKQLFAAALAKPDSQGAGIARELLAR